MLKVDTQTLILFGSNPPCILYHTFNSYRETLFSKARDRVNDVLTMCWIVSTKARDRVTVSTIAR